MSEDKGDMNMVWNEPGKDKKDSSASRDKKPPEGPPNLDEVLKKLSQNLKSLLGNRKKSYQGFQPPVMGSMGNQEWTQILPWVMAILVFLYLIAGIYVVDPSERAVVTRFGAYVRTLGPGVHWLPVLIESKELVNVEQIQTSEHRGLILTKNKNIGFDIGSVEIVVYYQIVNAKDFLFNVVDPVNTFKQVADSALRQVVGQSTLDEVLLTRAQISSSIQKQIKASLERYNTGIAVFDVVLKEAKAPDEVRAAFDDVIKAKEEAQRIINQAETYRNDVVPKANARASRIVAEAGADAEEAILLAEGNAERFNKVVAQYQKAQRVTQARLYIEAMEKIFDRSPKILQFGNNANNLMYLPIEKLMMGDKMNSKNESGGSP